VNEQVYSVDADIAVCLEYRKYFHDSNGVLRFIEGTAIIADEPHRKFTNFPEQQYRNGVSKNDETSRRYKKYVRILKKLSNIMAENGSIAAKDTSSFLIESLVWNTPSFVFDNRSFHEITCEIIARIWNITKSKETCRDLLEANGIKYLFHPSQSWTPRSANNFAAAAWDYIKLP